MVDYFGYERLQADQSLSYVCLMRIMLALCLAFSAMIDTMWLFTINDCFVCCYVLFIGMFCAHYATCPQQGTRIV
jgi:hypothetical protein